MTQKLRHSLRHVQRLHCSKKHNGYCIVDDSLSKQYCIENCKFLRLSDEKRYLNQGISSDGVRSAQDTAQQHYLLEWQFLEEKGVDAPATQSDQDKPNYGTDDSQEDDHAEVLEEEGLTQRVARRKDDRWQDNGEEYLVVELNGSP